MAEVFANHHDATVATNHLALVTDLLDARFDLHAVSSSCRVLLLVAVNDAAAGQVVRAEFDDDPVTRQDADVVHAHLAADVREYLVTVSELDPEHGVRERFDNLALDLDGPVFLRHILRVPSYSHTCRHTSALLPDEEPRFDANRLRSLRDEPVERETGRTDARADTGRSQKSPAVEQYRKL